MREGVISGRGGMRGSLLRGEGIREVNSRELSWSLVLRFLHKWAECKRQAETCPLFTVPYMF